MSILSECKRLLWRVKDKEIHSKNAESVEIILFAYWMNDLLSNSLKIANW